MVEPASEGTHKRFLVQTQTKRFPEIESSSNPERVFWLTSRSVLFEGGAARAS